jgi:thioredoxin 1
MKHQIQGGFMANQTCDTKFKKDVLKSKVPVLVDFWAPWCMPCRNEKSVLDRIGEKARVYTLNVDDNMRTAIHYGVTKLPTTIVFRNGRPEKTIVGTQPEQEYLKALGL